jgi:transposase
MISVTPQMVIWVACAPIDFRCGIDRLCQTCRSVLAEDPLCGAVFIFRNRRSTSIKVLVYDGQGYWLCQKRFSAGRFKYWPTAAEQGKHQLLCHELVVLLSGGDPKETKAAPQWRSITGRAV